MRSLWIVAHVSSMRIYSYYTKFLMLFNLSHTLGLLTSWESLLHWSENESEAKKLYEEMAALIGKLNQIGTTQSNLDTESAIHLAIEDAKVSSNAKLCLILDEGGEGCIDEEKTFITKLLHSVRKRYWFFDHLTNEEIGPCSPHFILIVYILREHKNACHHIAHVPVINNKRVAVASHDGWACALYVVSLFFVLIT